MKKIFLFLALFISLTYADELKISLELSELQKFAYENPDGDKLSIPDFTRTIVVSFEKDTGKLVNKYLDEKYPPYLGRVSAVFIADISEMPSIITKMFALPKMRDYKHTIYLHYDEEFAKYVPHKEDKITIIKLENQKVKSIFFITSPAELKSALES